MGQSEICPSESRSLLGCLKVLFSSHPTCARSGTKALLAWDHHKPKLVGGGWKIASIPSAFPLKGGRLRRWAINPALPQGAGIAWRDGPRGLTLLIPLYPIQQPKHTGPPSRRMSRLRCLYHHSVEYLYMTLSNQIIVRGYQGIYIFITSNRKFGRAVEEIW